MFKSTTLTVLSALLLFSCSDSKPKITNTWILTEKYWSIETIVENDVDITESEKPECEFDDLFYFRKDGTFTDNKGQVQCPDDTGDVEGTWSWKDEEEILSIQYPDDEAIDWIVLEIKTTTLKLSNYSEHDETTRVITLRSILPE
jgi:hypothetical protein